MTRGAESLIERAAMEKGESLLNSSGVTIAMVYPIVKTLTAKGRDPEAFFASASFDVSLLRQPEARIGEHEFERLMHAAADYTEDRYFGLRQGQLMEPADLGILGYVMMHSGTVGAALAAYRRYNDIACSGFRLDWEEDGEELTVRMRIGQSDGTGTRHCIEDMASSVYHLMGRMSSSPIPLREAAFAHERPAFYDPAPYRETFGIEPRFGASGHYLRMSRDVLDYPVLYADERLLGMFARIAEETMERLGRRGAFARDVSQWMMACLPASFPSLKQTSAAFHMSERSLQHRLKEEGTTFNALSAEVRKELALRYLRMAQYSIGDIAYLLHFSEPSAFQNAFKRWTGMTPGQYRM